MRTTNERPLEVLGTFTGGAGMKAHELISGGLLFDQRAKTPVDDRARSRLVPARKIRDHDVTAGLPGLQVASLATDAQHDRQVTSLQELINPAVGDPIGRHLEP